MFPCTNCGLCCKNIKDVKELKNFDRGDGVCKYLDLKTNLCTIYEIRPDICNIDKMFEKKYFKYFTKQEFYKENAKVCNLLQEKYNLDEIFRVRIKE